MEGDHTSTIIHVILSMDNALIQLKNSLKIFVYQQSPTLNGDSRN